LRLAGLALGSTVSLGMLFGLGPLSSRAKAQSAPQTRDLADATLDELSQIHISVSSFARKDEDLWKTPAAVFVITREDIARSSLSSIPELLRLVPGLQVAQIDASSWAISARGFNSVYAAKLLVLVDGRTVYSEIYSGSHWDEIDLPLETIDRIEVIRGPGAAVWGTNAVDGVVNIITKAARDTTGLLVSSTVSGLGDKVTAGYGGRLGERAQYRALATFSEHTPFVSSTGAPAFDGSQTFRTSARIGWQPNVENKVYLSADLYKGTLKQQIAGQITLPVGPGNQEHGSIAGGSIVGRLRHTSSRQDASLQVYFDDQSRHELAGNARTRTLDFDYQAHSPAGARNDLVWGAESRFTFDHIDGVPLATTLPEYRNFLVDGFLQDELTLIPKRLIATLGSKIQQGTLAGFQVQPSVRLLWAPDERQSVWAAVSRAAVAPSIQDKYVDVPLDLGTESGLPIAGALQGNPGFKPETVVAFELGYRRRIGSSFTLDVASFLNNNLRVESLTLSAPSFSPLPSPHIQTALLYGNGFRAKTGGAEGALSWRPLASLSFQASYAWMEARTRQVAPGESAIADAWNAPRNSLAVSGSCSLSPRWRVGSFLYRVDGLPLSGLVLLDPSAAYGAQVVPSYTRLDFHVSRTLGGGFQLDAGGTNLLTARHLEFGGATGFNLPSEVPRSLFLRGRFAF
jgi:iron complex outermembrane receptor protein